MLVYRNLHRDCWSVVDARTGRVALHADWVLLTGVRFLVSLAGRERAVREGRRNVHARVRGQLQASGLGNSSAGGFAQAQETSGEPAPAPEPRTLRRVTYNPFRLPYFHLAGTTTPVKAVASAFFDASGALWTMYLGEDESETA